jgi:hypothetical protein
MQAGKAAELRKAWCNEPCEHPDFEAEFYRGSNTGAFICVQCGRTFTEDEINNIRAFRDAIKSAIGSRPIGSLFVTGQNFPNPDVPIDEVIQMQLAVVTAGMYVVGTTPNDFQVAEFDRPIKYRKLDEKSLDWLEAHRMPVRRHFAPLGGDYVRLFGDKRRLPIPEENYSRFLSLLLHILQVESQIIVAKQYYHRLGLYNHDDQSSLFTRALLPELARVYKQSSPHGLDVMQFHGRVFLEYYAIMLRAQWDKLVVLSHWAFGLKERDESVLQKLKGLADKLVNDAKYHPWARNQLRIFIEIAQGRLSDTAWLRKFRDSLLHSVSEHSAGVIPRLKNTETTSDLWDKLRDEHDWLREGTLALLAAIASANIPTDNTGQSDQ